MTGDGFQELLAILAAAVVTAGIEWFRRWLNRPVEGETVETLPPDPMAP